VAREVIEDAIRLARLLPKAYLFRLRRRAGALVQLPVSELRLLGSVGLFTAYEAPVSGIILAPPALCGLNKAPIRHQDDPHMQPFIRTALRTRLSSFNCTRPTAVYSCALRKPSYCSFIHVSAHTPTMSFDRREFTPIWAPSPTAAGLPLADLC